MIREAGIWEIAEGAKEALLKVLAEYGARADEALKRLGVENASVWHAGGYVYSYRELPDDYAGKDEALKYQAEWWRAAGDLARAAQAPGTLRLMYHDIGEVRADKSLIRRRVFATILKTGCAEEYYNRHKALIDARGARISEGAETNFTIWCANDKLIFGYCELVKALDRAPSPEDIKATTEWETRQLEIMDWITDDVDWLTKQTHPKMECAFLQAGY